MEIEYVYPPVEKKREAKEKLRNIIQWCFAACAYACPIINLCTGGRLWCVVVLWGLWVAWFTLFRPALVEYNRISQTSKGLINVCILLILIDLVYSYGWAGFVVPIVCFGSLVIIGILFLSDLSKQRQNMMPMVWIIIASLLTIIGSFIGWPEMSWPMIVLGGTALALLLICYILLRHDLVREFKKRFHTQ